MGYQMKHGNSGVPFKMLGSSSLKEYASDAQRRALHAHKADGGAGHPGKMSDSPMMKKKGFKDNYQGPCWDGYKMVGTKMKNGREVPNCVPK